MPLELFRPRGLLSVVLVTVVCNCGALAQILPPPDAIVGPPVELGPYFGAAVSTAYDNNVTQMPGGAGARDSWIDVAKLLGGFDRTFDRQHVTAYAEVDRSVYRQESLYDYTAADLRADVKSNFPSNINTDFGFSRTQTLARAEDLNTIRRNVITTDAANGSIYFPIAVNWHSVIAGNGSLLRNSNEIDRPTNQNTAEGDLGFRYQTGAKNYVDLLARAAHTTYPDGAGTGYGNTSYRDRGAELRTVWKFSGSSQVVGHVGYLQRRYENLTLLNFSAPTYELTYLWTPSYKTILTLYVLRQAGPAGDSGYLEAVTHTYRITPAYLPAEKIRLETYYQWSSLDYYGNVQVLGAGVPQSAASTSRGDADSNYGVAAMWTPLRWLMLKLDLHHEQRSSNEFQFEFSENVAMLTVQAKF